MAEALETLVKRFWTMATALPVTGAWEILLDDRPLHTPARARLRLPSQALALAIAGEWQKAAASFEPAALPLTALANAAIDIVAADRAAFLDPLLRYAAFDLTCYRADGPATLVALQAQHWEPVLQAVEARHRLLFRRSSGIRHVEQPAATLEGIHALLTALDDFELAALQPLVTISGSAVLAIAHLDGVLAADAAFAASRIDEEFQQQQWGADHEAGQVAAARRAEFLAAARFLALARKSSPLPSPPPSSQGAEGDSHQQSR